MGRRVRQLAGCCLESREKQVQQPNDWLSLCPRYQRKAVVGYRRFVNGESRFRSLDLLNLIAAIELRRVQQESFDRRVMLAVNELVAASTKLHPVFA
jgi:hypothetical protein